MTLRPFGPADTPAHFLYTAFVPLAEHPLGLAQTVTFRVRGKPVSEPWTVVVAERTTMRGKPVQQLWVAPRPSWN